MVLNQTIRRLNEDFEICINHFLSAQNNHIFNDPGFFHLYSTKKTDAYIQLVRSSDRRVCATMAFYNDDPEGTFSSPSRGTFGGLSLNSSVDVALLEAYFQESISFLRENNGRRFVIKLAPSSHDQSLFSIFSNIVFRNSFRVLAADLNYDMLITPDRFIDRIQYGNVKRINKCAREGFFATELAPGQFHAAYELIAQNRKRRGFPITVSYKQLSDLHAAFPGRVHFFGVFTAKEHARMVASSICIEITDRILYVFYWGDAAEMETYSPTAFLASYIYEFCQRNDFQRLDAGISTRMGEPNYGLMGFKRNLGFSESLKLSVEYTER